MTECGLWESPAFTYSIPLMGWSCSQRCPKGTLGHCLGALLNHSKSHAMVVVPCRTILACSTIPPSSLPQTTPGSCTQNCSPGSFWGPPCPAWKELACYHHGDGCLILVLLPQHGAMWRAQHTSAPWFSRFWNCGQNSLLRTFFSFSGSDSPGSSDPCTEPDHHNGALSEQTAGTPP